MGHKPVLLLEGVADFFLMKRRFSASSIKAAGLLMENMDSVTEQICPSLSSPAGGGVRGGSCRVSMLSGSLDY